MHRNDPQTSPILWWPPKNIHKICIPKKNIHFSQNPKNIEIQNFEPQKIAWAYVCVKISEYPPPSPPPPSLDPCMMYHHIENCCYICSGGRVAGVVIGVLAACAGIGVGIYCLCTRVLRKKKSADTHGKVIKHEEKTTWNKSKHKWAVTCEFQQCGIFTCVESEEHVQPPFKLRNPKCS